MSNKIWKSVIYNFEPQESQWFIYYLAASMFLYLFCPFSGSLFKSLITHPLSTGNQSFYWRGYHRITTSKRHFYWNFYVSSGTAIKLWSLEVCSKKDKFTIIAPNVRRNCSSLLLKGRWTEYRKTFFANLAFATKYASLRTVYDFQFCNRILLKEKLPFITFVLRQIYN